MTKRLYIGKKDQADLGEDIGIWVDEKIPPPPPGLPCECDPDKHVHDDEYTDVACKRPATSYLYYVKGDHVCYTYVCVECCEETTCEDYLRDVEYPTTAGGYAVTPTRCINE